MKERITSADFELIVQDGIANYMDSQGGTEEQWRPIVTAYLAREYDVLAEGEMPTPEAADAQ